MAALLASRRSLAQALLGERLAAVVHAGAWAWRMPRHARHPERWRESWIVDRFLRAGDVALDVGAHGGGWTWLLSRRVDDEGRVVAVEALPHFARALALALRWRGCRNVEIVAAAAGSAAGVTPLVTRDAHGADLTGRIHVAPGAEGGDVLVPRITLDALLQRHPMLARVRLVKLDVEGAETDVLRGAGHLLRTARPAIWCEVSASNALRQGHSVATLVEAFAAAGYEPHELDRERGLVRRESVPDDMEGDLLFLVDEARP